jgi:GDPmannose 4,6-dehydratase
MNAIITGMEGQDGHYLAELLRSKGYEVADARVESVGRADEIYNLGALTRPDSARESFIVNAIGALKCLETGCKVFQASTREVFAGTTPYATAKRAAHDLTRHYRDAGAWAATGVLHSHESPRRTLSFVSQKVCSAAALRQPVTLGNLDARRDWGHAKDYVRAMWLIMQQDKPDEYEICTGQVHTVRELCEKAYGYMDLDYREFVTTSEEYFRQEPEFVPGDPSKIKSLGWEPEITFDTLIKEMVDAAAK